MPFLTALLLTLPEQATAQLQLQAKHPRKLKAKIIKVGQRIHYQLYSDSSRIKKRTGILTGVLDTVILVNGEVVRIDNIMMIGRRPLVWQMAKFSGMILGIPLFAFAHLQLLIGVPAFSAGVVSGNIFLWVGGLLDIAGGNFNRIMALLPYFYRYRHLNMAAGWVLTPIR